MLLAGRALSPLGEAAVHHDPALHAEQPIEPTPLNEPAWHVFFNEDDVMWEGRSSQCDVKESRSSQCDVVCTPVC